MDKMYSDLFWSLCVRSKSHDTDTIVTVFQVSCLILLLADEPGRKNMDGNALTSASFLKQAFIHTISEILIHLQMPSYFKLTKIGRFGLTNLVGASNRYLCLGTDAYIFDPGLVLGIFDASTFDMAMSNMELATMHALTVFLVIFWAAFPEATMARE